MGKYISLSYALSSDLSCYNNWDNIHVIPYKNREKEVRLIGHVGTHIDVPYHVTEQGRRITDYYIEDFIYHRVAIAHVRPSTYYVEPSDLPPVAHDSEFIILETGSWEHRHEESYALNNIGLSEQTAVFLRNHYPRLRAVGIDSISINAYEDKQMGREAHKSFLANEREILIVEDMNLSQLGSNEIEELIVAPLIVADGDGAPCQIIARLKGR